MDMIDILSTVYGWDAKAHRQEIREALQQAGLYLLGYEMLKDAIVHRVKDFYATGWDKNGITSVSENYQTQVLDLVPENLREREAAASVQWLVSRGAIDTEEAEELQRIRRHRNEIAHELPAFVLSGKERVRGLDLGLLHRVPHYLDKLDRFWANIEMDCTEEEYPDEAYEGATSMRSLIYATIYYDVTGKKPAVPEVFEKAVTGWAEDEME